MEVEAPNQVLQSEKRRYIPLSRPSIHLDEHRRTTGRKPSQEERRAVLHCFEVCRREKEARIVSTEDLTLRTATYLGIASKTVRDVLAMRNTKDRRGQYIRVRDAEILKPYHRNLAEQWTVQRSSRLLGRYTHQIQSYETITFIT